MRAKPEYRIQNTEYRIHSTIKLLHKAYRDIATTHHVACATSMVVSAITAQKMHYDGNPRTPLGPSLLVAEQQAGQGALRWAQWGHAASARALAAGCWRLGGARGGLLLLELFPCASGTCAPTRDNRPRGAACSMLIRDCAKPGSSGGIGDEVPHDGDDAPQLRGLGDLVRPPALYSVFSAP